jgi:hypothetical protein
VITALRRVAALGVALALLALVACDLWIQSVRVWWDQHSLTGSVVSSLLVLAVTALIVDEVVARRQRRERAVSVAVQVLIVYGQARRACDAIMDRDTNDTRSSSGDDELRTLASMLLTASPSLFDDPEARRFLEQVERFSVLMFRTLSTSHGDVLDTGDRDHLATELLRLRATVEPFITRIPTEDRSLLEGAPQS